MDAYDTSSPILLPSIIIGSDPTRRIHLHHCYYYCYLLSLFRSQLIIFRILNGILFIKNMKHCEANSCVLLFSVWYVYMIIVCNVWFCTFNPSCFPLPVVQLWKPKESLWRSWIWIADPDGGESALPGGHAVGVVVSIGAFGGSVRYHWPGGGQWRCAPENLDELASIAFPKSNAAVSMCCVLLFMFVFVWKMSKLKQIVLSVQTMHKTRQYGMNR